MSLRFAPLVVVLALFQGCTCLGRSEPSTSSPSPSSDSPSVQPDASQKAAPTLRGTWNGSEFEVHSALAEIQEKWVTVTLLNRAAGCEDRKLRETDKALQLTVPTGPANDFFAARPLALPLKLSGAGGVSSVPAGYSSVSLEQVENKIKGTVRGKLKFAWRTGQEEDAPVYDAQGSFEALVCNAKPTAPSMPKLDQKRSPVSGKVSGHERSFPTFLAFVQRTSDGTQLLRLKGYTRKEVSCYSEQPNTPYLFGPEVGPGPEGKYFVGSLMPVDWALQMLDNKFSERSVHAGEGSGLLQINEVVLGRTGIVRGEMVAVTVDEDEEEWSYELAGTFEAPLCEVPLGNIAP